MGTVLWWAADRGAYQCLSVPISAYQTDRVDHDGTRSERGLRLAIPS
jgi:hypothetical protein